MPRNIFIQTVKLRNIAFIRFQFKTNADLSATSGYELFIPAKLQQQRYIPFTTRHNSGHYESQTTDSKVEVRTAFFFKLKRLDVFQLLILEILDFTLENEL